MEEELPVKSLLLYRRLWEKGKKCHTNEKQEVSQTWVIVAKNRRGQTSNSCLNVSRNTLP